MNALLTDLYQLTMSAGYFEAGKIEETATFELFVRRLPPHRNYLVAAGLQQAVDYLLNLRFTSDEIDYLRGLPQFQRVRPEFFTFLSRLRFTGDLYAVPEGTPVFANEPLMILRAPIVEAQIPETYLLATIGFQTLVASKASRIIDAAGGRTVVEMGSRRAHTPDAGLLAARAAYLAGIGGSSNVEAGKRFGMPLYGTTAHSWVLSFPSERQAFEQLHRLLGPGTVYLIDSYDTLQGAKTAASLGPPLWGVRLDSGDLLSLSRDVRRILNDAGLHEAKIMATGDLNEYKIADLLRQEAPIDSFGVGTELSCSADSPAISAVYKITEIGTGDQRRYTAKYSADKMTLPGSKQLFRYSDRDVIGRAQECNPRPGEAARALLRPVILRGELLEPLPSVADIRECRTQQMAFLPSACRELEVCEQPYPVEVSAQLQALSEQVRQELKQI